MSSQIEIIAFYEFKDLASLVPLTELRAGFRELFLGLDIRGTIILAEEGFNGMVCGKPENIATFVDRAEQLLDTRLQIKSSYHDHAPFRRIDIKVKREIVTLKQPVDISLGIGTHVSPEKWNEIISDPETFVLDTRNDYEYHTGTFQGAMNPEVKKFSDLPQFIHGNLDPEKTKRVAMFCTGGIRCEKFAPYLKQIGFEEVYQLEGGILRYLETIPENESLWHGECFVFDERVTVDHGLRKGREEDHSQRMQSRKRPEFKSK
jgi:UPF0176 protein